MESITNTLPVEILTIIIDELAIISGEKDSKRRIKHEDLKACSLACRTFLHLCRRHIFKSISLVSHGPLIEQDDPPFDRPPAPTTLFALILTRSPVIAECVQKLHLTLGPRLREEEICPSLHSALRPLKNLKHLSFSGLQDWPLKDIGWQLPALRSEILNLIRLPGIVSIKVYRTTNFSVLDLLECPRLQKLDLDGVESTTNEDHFLPTCLMKPIHIEHLRCVDSPPYEEILTRKYANGRYIFDIEGLKSCVVEVTSEDAIPTVLEFLSHASSLESMEVGVEGSQGSNAGILVSAWVDSPSSLESLKSIHFVIKYDCELDDTLYGICQPLQNMPPRNRIEVLVIEVLVYADESCECLDAWKALETAILSPGWSCLKSVDIAITINRDLDHGFRYSEYAKEWLIQLPQQQLRRLASSKSFTFNFSVIEQW